MKRIIGSIVLLSVIWVLKVNAEDYIVYKARYTVRENNKQESDEWTYNPKEDQLKFTIYFVMRKDYLTAEDDAPARIVTFKSRQKVTPIDANAKTTKNLIIYPLDIVNAQTGEVTAYETQYRDLEKSGAEKYYIYGGLWTTVTIEVSKENKNRLAMIDYYDNMAGSGAKKITNTDGKAIAVDNLKGFSEFYTGYVRKDELATKLDGFLSFYTTDKTAKSQLVTLKYDKLMSTKVLASDDNSMRKAVNAVVNYLVSKKYASTWTE